MARVEITRHELQSGALPPVCAKSGEPTEHYVAVPVPIPHPRARALLLLGVVPYFVWRRFFARRILARIPLSRAMIDLRRRQHGMLVALATMATLVAVGGLVLPDSHVRLTVAAAGAAVALVVQTMLMVWRRDARVRFATTRYGTVILHGIHPAFRAALAGGERVPRPGLLRVNDAAATPQDRSPRTA